MSIKEKIKIMIYGKQEDNILKNYYLRFLKYAFYNGKCKDEKQFEASITRLYHTIEKGLAYENYRAGFGKDNIEMLISSLELYSKQYDTKAFFYQTALSTLNAYIAKNKEFGICDENIEKKLHNLPGKSNFRGGTILVEKPNKNELKQMNLKKILTTRHSIRHFTNEDVDLKKIQNALDLAQFTPSACNRQGWNTYIVVDKQKIKGILDNQNGNRGFGQEINKLLVCTFDLKYLNIDREIFQGFIDGGMFVANLINALYFEGIASIPLSASLLKEQENNIRKLIPMSESEILIIFIGLGCYPEKCLTTKSERRKARYEIV